MFFQRLSLFAERAPKARASLSGGGGGGGGPGACSPGNSTFTPSMESEGIACVAAVFMAACSIAARSLLALPHKKQSHTKKKMSCACAY